LLEEISLIWGGKGREGGRREGKGSGKCYQFTDITPVFVLHFLNNFFTCTLCTSIPLKFVKSA